MALTAIVMSLALAGAVPAAEEIRSIRDLIALPPEEAARQLPVRLEATLIFYDLTRATYFVHDGSASCRVVIPKDLAAGIRLLDRVELEGVSRKGGFLSDLTAHRLRVLGSAAAPAPRPLTGEDLFDPDACAQWVQVEGWIKGTHATDGGLALDLAVQGWILPAVLPGDLKSATPWHLLERRVRVTGIAGTFFNQERQMTGRYLHVPGMDFFELLAGVEPARPAVETVSTGLLRPHADPTQRLRLRGVVTAAREGEGLFLRDTEGSLRVRTAQPVSVQPGDQVEVEGLPAMEPYRPALRALEVRRLGAGPPPEPLPFRVDSPRRTREHHELVSLRARVVAVERERDALRLQCQAQGRFFEAQLDHPPDSPVLADLVPGAELRLTGLCQLQTSRFLFLPEYVDGFRLLLRDAGDVEVLRLPSWWTAERLLWLVGALVLFGLAAAGWAVSLRRRVAAQTGIIRAKVARETLLEERGRIARDWHDTMEQQLMGVSMLVEDASARLAGAPEAAERLGLAQRMLRHCRTESRASIRDLRSVALESGGLASACEEVLAPLARAAGAQFHLKRSGAERHLPGAGEHQILRIAQEAVANAAKHSGAREIRVELDYRPDRLTLTVSDDGKGFAPVDPLPEGSHLGLATMRERALRLGASLTLDSAPGRGTRVRVEWPFSTADQETT
jgi:signal transduction histidine kinase